MSYPRIESLDNNEDLFSYEIPYGRVSVEKFNISLKKPENLNTAYLTTNSFDHKISSFLKNYFQNENLEILNYHWIKKYGEEDILILISVAIRNKKENKNKNSYLTIIYNLERHKCLMLYEGHLFKENVAFLAYPSIFALYDFNEINILRKKDLGDGNIIYESFKKYQTDSTITKKVIFIEESDIVTEVYKTYKRQAQVFLIRLLKFSDTTTTTTSAAEIEVSQFEVPSFKFEIKCPLDWSPYIEENYFISNSSLSTRTEMENAFELSPGYFRGMRNIKQSHIQIIQLKPKNKSHQILFWILIDDIIKIFICPFISYIFFSRHNHLLGGINKETNEFYIWDIKEMEKSGKMKGNKYMDIYEGDLYELPEAMVKIDTTKRNVLAFEWINEIEEIFIFYDNYDLEFYRKIKDKTTLIFKYKLDISSLHAFYFDDFKYLYICEVIGQKSQLIKFDYQKKEFASIYKMKSIPLSFFFILRDKVLFYDKNKLEYSGIKRESPLSYNPFKTDLPLIFLTDSRNFKQSICKIAYIDDSEEGSLNEYHYFSLLDKSKDKLYVDKNIMNITFDKDGVTFACITKKYIVYFFKIHGDYFNEEVQGPLDISKLLDDNYANDLKIDFSGDFSTMVLENELYENQGYYYSFKLKKLTFVGQNGKNNIVVINYNFNNRNPIYDIYNICILNEDESEGIISYLKCKWCFSLDKDHILFYIANYEKSKLIIFDCPNSIIKDEVYFQNTLLIPSSLSQNRIFKNSISTKNELNTKFLIKSKEKGVVSESSNFNKINSENCTFPKFWFKNDNKTIIIRDYSKIDAFMVINPKSSQEMINEILSYISKENEELPDPLFYDDHMFFINSYLTTNQNPMIYICDVDELNSNNDIIMLKYVHLEFPSFFKDYSNQLNFNEKLIQIQNQIYYVMSYQSTDKDEEDPNKPYVTMLFSWDPLSLFNAHLMSYYLIKNIKKDVSAEDITHICDPEVINLTYYLNGNYLFKDALSDLNDKVVDLLISLSIKGQFKLKIEMAPEGLINKRLYNTETNLLKYFIDDENDYAIQKIISAITKNCVTFQDVNDTLLLCKDLFNEKNKLTYINLIKNMSFNETIVNIDIWNNGINYMYKTMDSYKKDPYWFMDIFELEEPQIVKKLKETLIYAEIQRFSYSLNNLIVNIDNIAKSSPVYTERVNEFDIVEIKTAFENFKDKYISTYKSIMTVFPLKGAAKIGEECMLPTLPDTAKEFKISEGDNIKILIDYKWNTFGKNIFQFEFFTHILLLITFTLYSVILFSNASFKYNFICYIFLLVSWILSFYNLVRVSIKLVRIFNKKIKYKNAFISNFQTWIYSRWNVTELIAYLFIIMIIPMIHLLIHFCTSYIQGNNVLQIIISLTTCLLWWKVLYYLLPFKSTGPLVIAIFEVIEDIRFFICVVFFVLIGFGTTFYILLSDEKSSEETKLNIPDYMKDYYSSYEPFGTFFNSLITTFGMMLGQFDLDLFFASENFIFNNLLLILYLMMMMVVMVNLLIAIMSDSYDKIRSSQEAHFYVARCQIINDIEIKLLDFEKQKINNNLIKDYLVMLKPQYMPEINKEWSGRIREIVERVRHEIKADMSVYIKEIMMNLKNSDVKYLNYIDNLVCKIESKNHDLRNSILKEMEEKYVMPLNSLTNNVERLNNAFSELLKSQINLNQSENL